MRNVEIGLRLMAVRRLGAGNAARLFRELDYSGIGDRGHLLSLGMTPEQAAQFLSFDRHALDDTLRWLDAPQRAMLTCVDNAYPALLGNIGAPPPVLFVSGHLPVLSSPQIALVGSRNNSAYGERWGQFFARELVVNGFVITSGLALGIDGLAHRAALDGGGKTIAVLGSGLNCVYPRRHQRLAKQIEEQGGAVISEFSLNTPPLPINFPRRNRIISGLSLGVLVVEASLRSGSLVTARYALEQNRDVFALPGPIGNPMTEGTHWLIQQGAYLVTHPKNIVEQIGSGLAWLSLPAEETISSAQEDVELPFADVLANVGDEVTPVDVVAERVGQPVPEVIGKLLDLELAGWIEAVPGGYVRLRRAGHVRRTHVLV